MTNYQITGRPDLAILDALWRCKNPITLAALNKHVCPQEQWVSVEAQTAQIRTLEDAGYVHRSSDPTGGPVYSITQRGRAHLIAADSALLMRPFVETTGDTLRDVMQPYATMADKAQPSATSESAEEYPRVVSVCAGQDEDTDPPVALLCVDEDELDNWWAALDVEAKADAFAQYSLSNDGSDSHVYIEPHPEPAHSIHIEGSIGNDSHAQLADEIKRLVDRYGSVLRKETKAAL